MDHLAVVQKLLCLVQKLLAGQPIAADTLELDEWVTIAALSLHKKYANFAALSLHEKYANVHTDEPYKLSIQIQTIVVDAGLLDDRQFVERVSQKISELKRLGTIAAVD